MEVYGVAVWIKKYEHTFYAAGMHEHGCIYTYSLTLHLLHLVFLAHASC
jgi:hypothetical protein